MKKIKKLAIATLSLATVVAVSSCNQAVNGSSSSSSSTGSSNVSSDFEEVETSSNSLRVLSTNQTLSQETKATQIKKEYLLANNGYKDTDKVSVIVTLKTDSLLDRYLNGNYSNDYESVSDYYSSYSGNRQIKKINDEQFNAIKSFQNAGYFKKVTHYYSTIMNGFSFETSYGNLEKIQNSGLVENVILPDTYNPASTTKSTSDAVVNLVDVYETGIFNSSTVDYNGDGTVVAVLDSGFDVSHEVFNNQDVLNSIKKETITVPYINERLSELNASKTTANLKPEDLYYSKKIPYVYDYADKDFDVNPADSEHGTHVAGIIGGKSDTITGVATHTQLALMKVFQDTSGGAQTEDILAALEDAVVLNVDAVNMSLGTSCGFDREVDETAVNEVYDKISEAGITLVAAASNDYSAGYGGPDGNTNKVTNPESGTVGSPSSYTNNLSVASISGVKSSYVVANDDYTFFFDECNSIAGKKQDFVATLSSQDPNYKVGEKNTYEYVSVPGVGVEASYKSINVTGKIALVKRGDNTFEEKVRIAKRHGAIGIIIYNNVEGQIIMTVSEEGHIAACSVTKEVGTKLASKSSGTVTFCEDYKAGPFMSDFSSWGPTPSLALKPEITAHGGDIYSSIPGGQYDRMSGTSMASPNMCGIIVLIRQYVKEKYPEFNSNEIEEMTNALLMSTATIAKNEEGNPYSPRKQGAGLASLTKATESKAYITVANSKKPKLELGDDPNKTGIYEMSFTINNMSDSVLNYTMDLDAFTESVSTSDSNFVSEKAHMLTNNFTVKVNGSVVSNKKITVAANSSTTVTLTLTLTSDDKTYLTKSFPYGMYVEGYAKATSDDEGGIDLNVPFLAFYGDWTEAPIFDKTFFEVDPDAKNNAIDDDDKVKADYYATRPYGSYYKNYILPLGTYIYNIDGDSTPIPGSVDHIAISSTYGAIDGLSTVYAGCLRASKEMVYTVTDTVTGEVIWTLTDYNARKAFGYSGSQTPAYNYFRQSSESLGLVNNRKYTFSMVGYLDYGDGGVANNVRNSFSFDFTMDDQAPTIKEATFEKTYDKTNKKDRYYVTLTVSDNHYVQSITPVIFTSNSSYTVLSENPTPVYGDFNSDTQVKIEITDYMDVINSGSIINNAICFSVDDYAMNSNIFVVELPGTTDKFKFTNDGTQDGKDLTIKSIYVDDTLDLTQFLTSETSTDKDYFKHLTWSSDRPTYADVQDGIVVGYKKGRVNITCRDAMTGNSATITIDVKDKPATNLNSFVMKKYNGDDTLNKISFDYFDTLLAYPAGDQVSEIGSTGDRIYTSAQSSIIFYPGETVKLHVNFDPWYVGDKYKQTWKSSNPTVVEVDQNGVVRGLKEGSSYVTLELEGSTQIARIRVTVNSEFIIENRTLVAYKGLGGDVVIPDDKGIFYIGDYSFCLFTADKNVQNPDDDMDFNKTPHSNTTVKSVKIPEGVEDIQKYAFYNCEALETVELPKSIRYIRQYAFSGNKSLKSINLEDVEVISDGCFYNCGNLGISETLDLSSCYTIGIGAFMNCTGLQTIDLSKLRNTGRRAFMGCTNLTTVTFNALTKLSVEMFRGTGLTSVELNVNQIPEMSFYDCKNLTSVVINGSVITIGKNAFANNPSLATATINASVEYLNEGAFANDTNLTSVVLPNSSVRVEDSIFSGDTALVNVSFQSNTYFKTFGQSVFNGTSVSTFTIADGSKYNVEKGLLLENGKVIVAAPNNEYGDYTMPASVEEIATSAFSGINNLTSLVFTKVVDLDSYAFANCSKLTSVTFADNQVISDYAFNGCNKLSTLNNISNVHEIGAYAFEGVAVSNLTLGDNTNIGDSAFKSTGLLILTLGNNNIIGNNAFRSSSSLQTITFGENNTVGEYAFYYARNLNSANIENLTGTIGAYAFANSTITSATINAREIGAYAFANNAKLGNITLGATVEAIDDYAFALTEEVNQTTLKSIVLPAGLTKLGTGAFMHQKSLNSINVPAQITKIEDKTFYNNVELTTATLSDNVTEIGAYAFYNCQNLSSVNTKNVEKFGESAFINTKALRKVSLDNAVEIGDGTFAMSGLNSSLYAPKLKTVGQYAFQQTPITGFDAPVLEKISTAGFYGTNLTSFTLANTLTKIDDLAFYASNLLEEFNYSDNGILKTTGKVNSYIQLNDGILYTVINNGKLNLSSVPAAKNVKNLDVVAGTISTSIYAGNSNKNIESIVLPDGLKTVGAFAFYQCNNLASVEFKSLNAPSLESYYINDFDNRITTNSPGYDKLHTYYGLFGLEIYYANFKDLVGTFSPITMILPKNSEISGYDSIQYEVFFGPVAKATRSDYTAMNSTSITYLDSMDKILAIKHVSLQDETLINTALTAQTNLSDDLTAYGYSQEELDNMAQVLATANSTLKALKFKTASNEVKELQEVINNIDTTFTISRLTELNELAAKLDKLKADEKSVLDLTQYNKLLASYQEYLDSLNSAIDTVDNITNNSYNYLGVAIVALTTTLAAAVLVITKKY